MSEYPDPPVAADTDIRDLDGFMLNTERLLASELWALSTGPEFKAAMGLWCRAWKQTPPGSLPDDDRVLAAFSGAGKAWPKVKKMALRGFIKCADGRLYHKVLCEDVARAAAAKAKRKDQTKAATDARRQRNEQRNDSRNVERNDAADDNVTTNVTSNVTRSQGRDDDETRRDETGSLPTNDGPNPARPDPPKSPSWTPEAEQIAADFLAIRGELWPNDSRLPAPAMTLKTQAQAWLQAGANRELCAEIMRRACASKIERGEGPPTHLGFCSRSMETAIASLKAKPGNPHGERPQHVRTPGKTAFQVALEAWIAGGRQGPRPDPADHPGEAA